ncbi:MAG: VOC family protein [bacterium]|nr:VOC family protein [bacterium]
MKLSLLVVYCEDLEVSLQYYDALGLNFVQEQHGKGPVHYSTEIGDCVLELYPATSRSGPTRFGLDIKEPADAIARLRAAGFDIGEWKAGAPMILTDPSGNKIHISAE